MNDNDVQEMTEIIDKPKDRRIHEPDYTIGATPAVQGIIKDIDNIIGDMSDAIAKLQSALQPVSSQIESARNHLDSVATASVGSSDIAIQLYAMRTTLTGQLETIRYVTNSLEI